MKRDGYKIDQVIDCRKLSCPLPVLKVKNAINQMEIGMVLEMIATDPGSVKDIPAWVKQTGHELLETAHEDGHFMFLIKKLR